VQSAVERAKQMAAEGADIIDVGGESTRPGAERVSLTEELRRVIPVVEAISAAVKLPISVDTYKAEVARQALEAGAHLINKAD
jgi:dihydropteroate synthase